MLELIVNRKSLKADGTLIISGVATSNVLDKHGESITISPNAFKEATKETIPLKVQHETTQKYGGKAVGKVLSWDYEPKDYSIDSPTTLEMVVKVVGEITDPQAVQDELEGNFKGLSLGWRTNNWLYNEKTGQRIDTEVTIDELSLVDSPANPQAVYTRVTDDDLAKQYGLGQRMTAFEQEGEIKEVLKNEKGEYFARVEFDTIQNYKSLVKLQDMEPKNYEINISQEQLENAVKQAVAEYMQNEAITNKKSDIIQTEIMEDEVLKPEIEVEVETPQAESEVEQVLTDEISEDKGDATPSTLEKSEEKMYSQAEMDEIKAMYEAKLADMELKMSEKAEIVSNKSEEQNQTEQSEEKTEEKSEEISNEKSLDSKNEVTDFDTLVEKYGYQAALKIQQGLIVL